MQNCGCERFQYTRPLKSQFAGYFCWIAAMNVPQNTTRPPSVSRNRSESLGRRPRIVTDMANTVLDVLFPPRCVFCAAELCSPCPSICLCEVCKSKLAPVLGITCRRCGAPRPAYLTQREDCVNCRGQRLCYACLMALGWYRDELRDAVLRMKYPGGESLSTVMGRLAADRLFDRIETFSPDLVVPVPMRWTRRLIRGTNSPDILAATMGQRCRIEYQVDLLKWRRKVKKQSRLSPQKRVANVRGALRVSRGYILRGARILLIDDVMTTGATSNEAVRMLLSAGADAVAVTVVARALSGQ